MDKKWSPGSIISSPKISLLFFTAVDLEAVQPKWNMFWNFISTPFLSLRLMLHLYYLPIPPLQHGPHPTPRMGGYQSLWLIFRIRIASGEDGFSGEQCISKKRGLALSPLKLEARFGICAACWFNTLQRWAAWPTHILHSTRTTGRQWQLLKRVKKGAKCYVCGFSGAWKWKTRAWDTESGGNTCICLFGQAWKSGTYPEDFKHQTP